MSLKQLRRSALAVLAVAASVTLVHAASNSPATPDESTIDRPAAAPPQTTGTAGPREPSTLSVGTQRTTNGSRPSNDAIPGHSAAEPGEMGKVGHKDHGREVPP